MIEVQFDFKSENLTLSAVLRCPDDIKPREKRAAFIVLHGFGSNKDSGNVMRPVEALERLGYITLRFDMRGCGKSEGEKGRIICLDQVEDTRNALSALLTHPNVAPAHVGVIGTSFGGAVSVYTTGLDERFAACISNDDWGDGERKFRGQHPAPDAWKKFSALLERGRRVQAGKEPSFKVRRYDLVAISKKLSDKLSGQSVEMFPPGTIGEFPIETALSMMDFRAEDMVGQIAPRPLLLLHASIDTVTPTEQSIEMFKRAGQPTELHLIIEVDHFMFAEGDVRIWSIMRDCLARYFPAEIEDVYVLLPLPELRATALAVFKRRDMAEENAAAIAGTLIWANRHGYDCHGVEWILFYLGLIDCSQLSPDSKPEILSTFGAIARIDAHRLAGPVAMKVGLRLVLNAANGVGVGWVSIVHTTHTGAVGFYAEELTSEGTVGGIGVFLRSPANGLSWCRGAIGFQQSNRDCSPTAWGRSSGLAGYGDKRDR